MKGILLKVDGRKILHIGNIIPNEKILISEKIEIIQEFEYDELKMIQNYNI